MNEAALEALTVKVRTHTPLVRLSHEEAKAALAVILTFFAPPKTAA